MRSKHKFIVVLYDIFFKEAFLTVERLGIVYYTREVVDFHYSLRHRCAHKEFGR
jgi:predicted helicase